MSKLMSSTLAFKVALCWELVQVTSKQCLSGPSAMVICRCSEVSAQVVEFLGQQALPLLLPWTVLRMAPPIT